jgi:hypothetical protein
MFNELVKWANYVLWKSYITALCLILYIYMVTIS